VKALVRSTDGFEVGRFEVVFPIVATLEWVEAHDGTGITAYAKRWDSNGFVPAPAARRVIPPLEFLQCFTPEERAAIRAAAAASPELADWIDQARFAREIELDAPTTAAGLDCPAGRSASNHTPPRRGNPLGNLST
jgi:hypothetical protein